MQNTESKVIAYFERAAKIRNLTSPLRRGTNSDNVV